MQVVYFEGRAEIQCKGGAVWIQGYAHLQPPHSRLQLAACPTCSNMHKLRSVLYNQSGCCLGNPCMTMIPCISISEVYRCYRTYVEDGASPVRLCAAAEAGGLLPIRALPSNTQAHLSHIRLCRKMLCLSWHQQGTSMGADRLRAHVLETSTLGPEHVQYSVQVPRAPSSCTVMFAPPKEAEADSQSASGWSVHGEDRSQATLHILPEWAEVLQADPSPLWCTFVRDEAHACSCVKGVCGVYQDTS